MSLVTHSKVNRRVYERAFDHDEARALRKAGWKWQPLADRFGVSVTAVQRVCNPDMAERMAAAAHNWIKENKREPCRGGCGRLVWLQNKGRTGYCPTCRAREMTAADERDGELRCTHCDTWKPDGEFSRAKRPSRRGRRNWCRACETKARRANRQANQERERESWREYKRKKEGRPMSVFVVMRKGDQGQWDECARVQAPSRNTAIEQTADGEGVYIAITEGQMKELPVRETVAFKVAVQEAA